MIAARSRAIERAIIPALTSCFRCCTSRSCKRVPARKNRSRCVDRFLPHRAVSFVVPLQATCRVSSTTCRTCPDASESLYYCVCNGLLPVSTETECPERSRVVWRVTRVERDTERASLPLFLHPLLFQPCDGGHSFVCAATNAKPLCARRRHAWRPSAAGA